MAWSLQSIIRSNVTVNSVTFGFDSDMVSLNVGETATCLVSAGFISSPTADLYIQCLVSNDGGTTWSNLPVARWSVAKVASTTKILPIIIPRGFKAFKLQFADSTGTDNITVSVTCTKDGVNL